MPIEIRRGEPTPPMAFGPAGQAAGPGRLPRRLSGPVVDIPTGLLERLRSACPLVDAPDALDEAGRDWWPLALTWAVAGQVPSRPAAIARPAPPPRWPPCCASATRPGCPVTAGGRAQRRVRGVVPGPRRSPST